MRPKPYLVELDQTLSDLYALDGGNPEEVAHMIALSPPDGPVSTSLPENTKYTFQTPMAPKLDKDLWARICLGNGSQNHAFTSGSMPLYLFDITSPETQVASNNNEAKPSAPPIIAREDAQRVYNSLVPWQRPKLSFVSDSSTFESDPDVKISPYPPLDFLDKHPCLLDQNTHYRLLSKRDLALSGLPTPRTELIDSDISPLVVHQGGDSEAAEAASIAAETQRMLRPIRERTVPFVIKFPQSLAGQGVFVIRDEMSKLKRIRTLEREIPRMIRTLNASNAHLRPVSLLIQDLVQSETVNLSLFVTRKGRAVFISAAEQFLDKEGIYRGSILDYARQSEFEHRYQGIMQEMARYVYRCGFYGPMGGDIMTDATAEGRKDCVVDLNVRLPGDYMMGPLRGHFWERRSLRFSYLITPLVVLGTADEFEEKFEQELVDGRMIIVGWSSGKDGELIKGDYGVCSVAVGGIDRTDVLTLVDRINALGLTKPT